MKENEVFNKCFQEGWECYKHYNKFPWLINDGTALKDCPYREFTFERAAWLGGFHAYEEADRAMSYSGLGEGIQKSPIGWKI